MGDPFGEGSVATEPEKKAEGQPEPEGQPKSWYDAVPEPYKETPYLQGFKEKPFEEFVKSAVEGHKRSGSRIVKPGENATEEEVNAYLDNFRPASPDKYEIKLPEGFKVEDEVLKSYTEHMHKLGATNEAVNGNLEFFAKLVENGKAAMAEQEKAQEEQQRAALKEKFGDSLVDTLKLANRVAYRFGGEEFEKFVKESKLHLNTAFIETFSKIGQSLGDHIWVSGGERPTMKSVGDYEAEIARIRNDRNDPFNQSNHPDRAKRAAHVELLTQLMLDQKKADREAALSI